MVPNDILNYMENQETVLNTNLEANIEQPKAKKKTWWIWLVLALLLIVGGGYYYQTNQTSNIMKSSPEKFFDGQELILVKSALDHDTNTIKSLLKSGVDVNFIGKKKMTPLIYVILKQDKEAAKILLDVGADASLVVEGVGSAMGIASQLENTDILMTLINSGININAHILTNDQPLTWYAAEVNNLAALEILFKNGLSVDTRNSSGNTLLIESIMVNNIELALWLIDHGSNVHAINIFLISAAECIQSRANRGGDGINASKYQHLVKIFEDKGVQFPVPESLELKEKLKVESVTVEEAEKLNEKGEKIK